MDWLWELCEVVFRARYSILTMALPAILGGIAVCFVRRPGTLYSLLLLRAFRSGSSEPVRFARDLFLVSLLSFAVVGLGGIGVRLVQVHGDDRFDLVNAAPSDPAPRGEAQALLSREDDRASIRGWPPALSILTLLAGATFPAACALIGWREGSLARSFVHPLALIASRIAAAAVVIASLAFAAGALRVALWGTDDWVLPFAPLAGGRDDRDAGLLGALLQGHQRIPGYVGTDGQVYRGHLDMMAVVIFAGFFYGVEFVRTSKAKPPKVECSTGAYLLVCIGLAGLILAGAAFWFDRYGWSPLLLAAILAGTFYCSFRTDHYFQVDADARRDASRLRSDCAVESLPEIAAVIRERTFPAGRDGKRTLFVVAAAGGGIQASAWTARVLTGLGRYPIFKHSLGLISAVSGGSVGSAYFLLGAYPGATSGQAAAEATHSASAHGVDRGQKNPINKKARQSLLEPVAWGVAFSDIPRLFTGWFPRDPLIDRGWALEQALESRFGFDKATGAGVLSLMLRDLCRRVRPAQSPGQDDLSPRMPIPLFNATCVETGQRIIMAPVRFGDEGQQFNSQRPIHFLTDYSHGSVIANPTLATAVRLSATFCYASPVARPTRAEAERWAAQFAGDEARRGEPNPPAPSAQPAATKVADGDRAKRELYKLHLCDGGYADNTGVVSAMDACRSVIASFESDADRPFDQIVLLRIDPFPKPQTSVAGTNEGFLQAVFGPVFSLLSARSATQLERADREIERCAEFARDRGFELYSTLIRFGDHCDAGTIAKPPLSWALSARQEKAIEEAWGAFAEAIDGQSVVPGCGPGKRISLGALLGMEP